MSFNSVPLVNLVDSSDNRISIDWINFYQNELDDLSKILYKIFIQLYGCPCCGAKNVKLVGAHVGYLLKPDSTPYIAPLCQTCNHSDDVIYVPDFLPLVPVPRNSPNYSGIKWPDNKLELMAAAIHTMSGL